jgi:hypothetical protein
MENLDAPLKKAKARCPWIPKIPKKKDALNRKVVGAHETHGGFFHYQQIL